MTTALDAGHAKVDGGRDNAIPAHSNHTPLPCILEILEPGDIAALSQEEDRMAERDSTHGEAEAWLSLAPSIRGGGGWRDTSGTTNKAVQ
jgi:hypothetical protein